MAKRYPKLQDDQYAVLSERMKAMIAEKPRLADLYTKLLDLGGLLVVPRYEEDLEKILQRGRVFFPKGAKKVKGRPSACHANVASIYAGDPRRHEIATGYALSDDGLWRQHTWGYSEGRVVETTVPRELYYGFIMSRPEAVLFCLSNY